MSLKLKEANTRRVGGRTWAVPHCSAHHTLSPQPLAAPTSPHTTDTCRASSAVPHRSRSRTRAAARGKPERAGPGPLTPSAQPSAGGGRVGGSPPCQSRPPRAAALKHLMLRVVVCRTTVNQGAVAAGGAGRVTGQGAGGVCPGQQQRELAAGRAGTRPVGFIIGEINHFFARLWHRAIPRSARALASSSNNSQHQCNSRMYTY